MILYERQFRKQWLRGKLSRKIKKRLYDELWWMWVMCEIPAPCKDKYYAEVQYVAMCAAYQGHKWAEKLNKAIEPVRDNILRMSEIVGQEMKVACVVLDEEPNDNLFDAACTLPLAKMIEGGKLSIINTPYGPSPLKKYYDVLRDVGVL